ncbi:uncharacterized protein LOC128205109 [Mya arenaria]|uniref:uncharacterized protein LOC128205109 n=1 Tax=Mya arenaria TaxID=6604 RepID=UPI0022E54EE4|nr:uncharacterized protein LOC128205109 [Mya arenaria]
MTGLFQLLLLVSMTFASEPSCPACSKYDYDQKVLERMVRMEFAFEKLGEKVEQNLNNIKDEKERLHAVVDVMKDQQEQAERRLVSVMEEVERNQSSRLEKVVTDEVEQMNVAFNKIQDQIASALVYFHARSPQITILSTGEVIVYSAVETNQGNGYSSTTGKFTAPARGLYLFFMHTCTPSTKFAYLQIVKEGSVLIADVHYNKDMYICSSSQVFVQLDAGETVWVQCSAGGTNRQLYENHSYQWSSFGGALIHN